MKPHKPRVMRFKFEFSFDEDALYARAKRAYKRVRRFLTFGPPFHTFVVQDRVLPYRYSESFFPAPKVTQQVGKTNVCIWCNREERWWRQWEMCDFSVSPADGPFGPKRGVQVETTRQVAR